MKRLLVALSALCTTASAQTEIPPVILTGQSIEDLSKIELPFRGVKVLDVRFDRSNIGNVNKNGRKAGWFYRLPAVFPDRFDRYLPIVLNNLVSFHPESNDSLVILIKQFRLTDYLWGYLNPSTEPLSLLKLSVSFYRQQATRLTKLFALDETISMPWPKNEELSKDFITYTREASLTKLLRAIFLNKNWQSAGPSFLYSSVADGIQKRFLIPALTDTILKAGVYASFQEFKANTPSRTDVSFNYAKGSVESVEDKKGNRILLRQMWGVCDGNKRYIVFNGKLSELLPIDRSFCFRSSYNASDLAGNASYGNYATQMGLLGAAFQKSSESHLIRQYFYLNMDEDDVYLEEIFGKSGLARMHRDLLK